MGNLTLPMTQTHEQKMGSKFRRKAHLVWSGRGDNVVDTSRLDHFMLMWPPEVTDLFVEHTSTNLVAKKKAKITKGEFFSLSPLSPLTSLSSLSSPSRIV